MSNKAMSTKKPSDPTLDDLLLLRTEFEAVQQVVTNHLKSISERINRLIPDEVPVKHPVRDWRQKVKSWRSWQTANGDRSAK